MVIYYESSFHSKDGHSAWLTMSGAEGCQFTMFEEKNNGIFISKNPFLDILLMKVKNLNSWSSMDFDKDETNYVSIVTSGFSEENIEVKNLLKGLEQLLGFRICCDN